MKKTLVCLSLLILVIIYSCENNKNITSASLLLGDWKLTNMTQINDSTLTNLAFALVLNEKKSIFFEFTKKKIVVKDSNNQTYESIYYTSLNNDSIQLITENKQVFLGKIIGDKQKMITLDFGTFTYQLSRN